MRYIHHEFKVELIYVYCNTNINIVLHIVSKYEDLFLAGRRT